MLLPAHRMASGILSSVKTASSNLLRQCLNRTVLSESVRCASYDPYPKFEAPTPYKPKKCNKYGYHYKLYDGGWSWLSQMLGQAGGNGAYAKAPGSIWRTRIQVLHCRVKHWAISFTPWMHTTTRLYIDKSVWTACSPEKSGWCS